MKSLTVSNHNRDSAGLKYVYPVMSRRAGGLSIGINVNTNNACNWRCIYCQVPDLIIGAAPEIAFELLEEELTTFIDDVLNGHFYDQYQVPIDKRVIRDIAISGNGEPTSVKDFEKLIVLIGQVARKAGILPDINIVLITNGSLIHHENVQQGLKQLQALDGEIWFKLDSATAAGRKSINNTQQSMQQLLKNIYLAAELCSTKIQTCLFIDDGKAWPDEEQEAYLATLEQLRDLPKLREILLYTIARPSLQPEAQRLQPCSSALMQAYAQKITPLGFKVSIY